MSVDVPAVYAYPRFRRMTDRIARWVKWNLTGLHMNWVVLCGVMRRRKRTGP